MQMKMDGDAVGIISILDEAGKLERLGTAFCFLKSNWFVTAKHVVLDEEGYQRSSKIFISNPQNANGQKHSQCKIIFKHDYHDIAILQTASSNFCEKPFYPAHHEFVGGKGLMKIGYQPSNGTITCTAIRGYETEIRSRNSGDELIFSFEEESAEGGNSGGPILGDGGGVVGITIEKPTNSNICRATSINVLLDALELIKIDD